mmetsp:Transcript_33749/g.101916  ORF Transcript_33749/g.101916 Transcript_33749/m.101916 type:complete len:249 (-) Transcript_33749:1541-2287(-)
MKNGYAMTDPHPRAPSTASSCGVWSMSVQPGCRAAKSYITKCHRSPVAPRNSSTKALPKLWKLAPPLVAGPTATVPKRPTPRHANIKISKAKSADTLTKPGKAFASVLIMMRKETTYRVKRKTLPTRKARSMLLIGMSGSMRLKTMLKSEAITTTKSNMFHALLKYAFLCAKISSMASRLKMRTQATDIEPTSSANSALCVGWDMQRRTVLIRIVTKMKRSQTVLSTRSKALRRHPMCSFGPSCMVCR